MNIDVLFNPIQLFYYKCACVNHLEIKQQLLHEIDNCDAQSDPNIFKVDWVNGATKDREWMNIILPTITSYMSIIGHAAGYKTPLITDIWFQQYQKNNIHDWHIHGQQFVGVYYLELNESSPKTEYIEPFTGKSIEFDITEGDILVFPSSLVHRAPILTDDTRKTIVSWNFNFNEPILNLSCNIN